MTETSHKVDWCLEKAKKELQLKKKHRGLVKQEPDIENAKNHIIKAEHNLSAISYFDKGGFSDWSMSATFYSIYHCFLAIAAKFGYESRNQDCTIALIKSLKENKQIELDSKFIEALENYDEQNIQNVIEKRELYTYGTTLSVKRSLNKSICETCNSFLQQGFALSNFS